jgi:uncharacterized protein
MQCIVHSSAAEFLDKAQLFLMRNELENAITLGAALQGKGHLFAGVMSQGSVIATAFSATGSVLWLSDCPAGPASKIAQVLHQHNRLPREICAPSSVALEFTQSVAAISASSYCADYGLRLYQTQLSTLIPRLARPTAGNLVLAQETDLPLVLHWASAFGAEVNYGDDAAVQAMATQAVLEQRLYFWHNVQPVAMLWRSSPTPNTERVGMVYTPVAQRGQGFSAAANLALAKLILASGKQTVCLLADLTNPISNALYLKLGYRPVVDLQRYLLQ